MKKPLPRTVVILGLVSFFNDLASEMVTPLIPILLATVLGAGPVALGLIEGMADAVSSLLKLWSGRFSDVLGGRRKWLTFYGYLISNITRPALGLAGSWWMMAGLRSIDRVGKGLRTAPRDALVSDAVPPEIRGYAYGFHRALDNAGGMGGSLLAAAVLTLSSLSLSQVILWSAIPGLIGVLLIAFGIKEKTREIDPPQREPLPPLSWRLLSAPMRRYLMVLVIFTFARASETFIVLRGNELGMGVVELLLLWAALNGAKSASSWWGGKLADALGLAKLVLIGWVAYSAGFLLLGAVSQSATLWAAAITYGFLAGLSEGGERALIGAFAGADERGTAFGWYNMALGLAAIPAGLLFGGIWHFWGAGVAFTTAGLFAALAAILLHFWARVSLKH